MSSATNSVSYLTAKQALEIDQELMGPSQAFSLDQLMENAGISVAHAAVDFLNHHHKNNNSENKNDDPQQRQQQPSRILILCGVGNNGGDGLVAARHLSHFGHRVTVVYPRALPESSLNQQQQLYANLLTQCRNLNVEIRSDMPGDSSMIDSSYDLMIDAVFGFSFAGTSIRTPFDSVIRTMNQCRVCPILSVDIPSGWHVEQGNVHGLGPERVAALISLTAPKLCAKHFTGGVHYLGGRFVPPAMAQKWNLVLPPYQGIDIIVKL